MAAAARAESVVNIRTARARRMKSDPINDIAFADCRDRSVGHDWKANIRWEDGPERKVGRRTEFITFRIAVCPVCSTERKEVFIQVADTAGAVYALVKDKNRYSYPLSWKLDRRVSQDEIHAAQWRNETWQVGEKR